MMNNGTEHEFGTRITGNELDQKIAWPEDGTSTRLELGQRMEQGRGYNWTRGDLRLRMELDKRMEQGRGKNWTRGWTLGYRWNWMR
jgi:hypothetical protein